MKRGQFSPCFRTKQVRRYLALVVGSRCSTRHRNACSLAHRYDAVHALPPCPRYPCRRRCRCNLSPHGTSV